MVKTFKTLCLRNQTADDLQSWYAALVAQATSSSLNNDPLIDPDPFNGKVKFGHIGMWTGKGVETFFLILL